MTFCLDESIDRYVSRVCVDRFYRLRYTNTRAYSLTQNKRK